MPYHKQSWKYGNLFIVFKIKFPDTLSKTQIDQISEALSFQKKKKDVDMNVSETCKLIEFKDFHKNTHHEGGTHGQGGESDDEDDDPRGGARVKCNQQ